MYKLSTKYTVKEKVRGVFYSIPYEIRVPDGNWEPYFGNYQNQKWGQWDTNSCWCLAAVNCLEDQLEWLYKNNQFGEEAIRFFKDNGYIDEDGDFSISERHLEILGGLRGESGNSVLAWSLMEEYGCVPRSKLNYTLAQANKFYTNQAFINDYFNKSQLTTELAELGKKFKKYVNIDHHTIGTGGQRHDITQLQTYLKMAPLQVGIPITKDPEDWNNSYIKWDGNMEVAHSVELYRISDKKEYPIFDQYEPHLKVLSYDYPILYITQGVVRANPQVINSPVNQNTVDSQVWRAVYYYYEKFRNLLFPKLVA